MALLDFLIGKRQDPAEAAQPYFNKAEGLYNPFLQYGNEAADILRNQFSNMAQNPEDLYNKILGGYQQSEGFKQSRDEALQAAQNSAAASGRRGTPGDLLDQGKLAASLQSADMQNYLRNILGIQGTGLQGAQNLYAGGQNAANALGGIYGTQAGMASQGAIQANQDRLAPLQALAQAGGGVAGALMGNPQFTKWMTS